MNKLHNHVFELLRKHSSKGRAFLYTAAGADDVEVSSESSYITGASGRKYLDFGSFAIFLIGHRPPEIVSSVMSQISRLPGSSRSFPNLEFVTACRDLASLSPEGLDKVMLLNSGSEAVEAAAKLARALTKRPNLVHIEKSYHGKSFGALSLTDSPEFRRNFFPLLPNVTRVSRSNSSSASQTILELKPAAVFIEPIQGEGGIYEVDDAYMLAIRKACTEAGSLLVLDEIQCGLGRSGSMWALQRSGIVPDILLVGKALGGGILPVSALVATIEAFAPYDVDPILHSSTFGGNPLASAVVSTMTNILTKDHIPDVSNTVGLDIKKLLTSLVDSFPNLFIKVSGRGLMLGLHCKGPDISGIFIKHCLQNGLMLSPCLTTPSVLRVTPPVTLIQEDIRLAEKIFENSAYLTLKEI
jgi:putrescine aminotransferase